MSDIVIYGGPLSPEVRQVEAVLHEKGLAYEAKGLKTVNQLPWLQTVSPDGRVPVLHDRSLGESPAEFAIPDASAICAYLEHLAPSPALLPTTAFDAARVRWLESFALSTIAGTIGPGLVQPLLFQKMQNKDADFALARRTLNERLPRILSYLEAQLDDGNWFIGESMTLADIAIGAQLLQLDILVTPSPLLTAPLLEQHTNRIRQLSGISENLRRVDEMLQSILPEPFEVS